jgi:DUF971 family protein
MTVEAAPWPLRLTVRRAVEITFDDGARFVLPARLLRAMTPSAEAHGHGGPDFQPVAADPAVALVEATPVGRYAVRLRFDDGHASGLYTWERLHRIGRERAALERAIPPG